MTSPKKTIVINLSERAVSSDINRLQQFDAQFDGERYRSIQDTSMATDDLDAAGIETPNTTQLSPDSAIITNGLRVVPGMASLGVQIMPGEIDMFDPDASPDPSDSQYKTIQDPGITGLAMTVNSSGQTRIDVIECSRTPLTILETDSRDIFNNVSGLFSPGTVNKVAAATLSYRIRVGTPGAGFPGTATGWVPLAVASVPTGTTTNDTITFWDVRPMLEDRIFSPYAVGSDYPRWHHANYTTRSGGGIAALSGTVDVSASDITTPSAGRRRLGGRLRASGVAADFLTVSGATVDGLDLNSTDNQSNAFTTGIGYIYLLEPFGLPRWARYTNVASGKRVPRSPRGFLTVSSTTPNHFYGIPIAGIGLPASTGLGATTTNKGVCIGAVKYTGGVAGEVTCDGRMEWMSGFQSLFATKTGTDPYVATFSLIEGTHYMPGAKTLTVEVTFDAGPDPSGGTVDVAWVVEDQVGNAVFNVGHDSFPIGSSNFIFVQTRKIPVPSGYPYAGNTLAGTTLVITVTGATSVTTPSIQVIGWDLY